MIGRPAVFLAPAAAITVEFTGAILRSMTDCAAIQAGEEVFEALIRALSSQVSVRMANVAETTARAEANLESAEIHW